MVSRAENVEAVDQVTLVPSVSSLAKTNKAKISQTVPQISKSSMEAQAIETELDELTQALDEELENPSVDDNARSG